MKKHFHFLAAVAALMTCACSVEPVDVVDVQPEEEGEFTVLTAGFAGVEDETRTVRQADGKVFWSPGDAISIIRGTSSSGHKKFVADNTEPSPMAAFSGTMPSGSTAYWAVYPYKADDYFNGTYLVTTLPSKQEAVAGSFADDLFISAAYVRNNVTSLTFRHQVGGVKFSVTQPGVKRVTLIAADENAFLAGLIGLYCPTAGQVPYIRATGYPEDMSSTIELSAPEGETLQVGEAYHFVTMPSTLNGGFTLLFEKEDGSIGFRTISKTVSIQAGHFATLMEADKGVSYRNAYLEYSPEEVMLDGFGGLFSIRVNGTLDYHFDASMTDWIKEVSATGDVRLGREHAFQADPNDEGAERTGMITICFGDNCYPILVTQSAKGTTKVIPHHSLGMRFTATWCGYCPVMSETFRLAKEQLGDRFEYVCIYATYQNSNYSSPVFDPLEDQYSISSWPTGIVDGRFLVENYESTYAAGLIADAVAKTEAYYPAVTSIALKSSVSGRNVTVDADVFALIPETYKLTVLLVEDGIVGYQNDYNDSPHQDFVHNRVARMALTSPVTGAEFDVDVAGETKSFSYTATVPSECNLDNMVVLAFVQRNFNDRPAIQSGKYGEWYVDNCRAAALGTTAPLEVQ